jgi:hypothetical protein
MFRDPVGYPGTAWRSLAPAWSVSKVSMAVTA